MNKKRSFLAAVLLSVCTLAGSQSYQGVMRANFWNDGPSVAGIRNDSASASYAEFYGNYVTGNYRSASEAPNAWTVGARAASIKHEKRFSMVGSFGFEQFTGYDMCGSMFIKQGFYPINVYEFTPGTKTLQTYSMSGGISVDLNPSWRIGGKLDFESSNYSKRKDLRHTNYRLDMTVSPCIQWHSGPYALGLCYIWSRNTETVNAEQVGSTAASYEVFFDEGMFYGVNQVWTGSGVHLNEQGVSGLPVQENINGLSLQASAGNAYADVQWRWRSGFAGEKQTVWYRFSGWDAAAHLGWRFASGSVKHTLRAAVNVLDQDNNKSVLNRETVGGITTTSEIGSNLIFTRLNIAPRVSYDIACGPWGAGATLSFAHNRARASNLYPFVMEQNLRLPGVELRGSRALGAFAFRLAARYNVGFNDDTVRSVNESSGVAVAPLRLERYFIRFNEQMTVNQLTLCPGVRLSFGRGFYADASAVWVKGFNVVYLAGDTRTFAALSLGYNF